MLQLRQDTIKRLLVIGEDLENERVEYPLDGTFVCFVTEKPKTEQRTMTREEFEKCLRTV